MHKQNDNIDAQRLATAWDWLFRMREEPVNPDELAAWLKWYESDEQNQGAYDEAQAFWLQSSQVAQPAALAPRAMPVVQRAPQRRRRAWTWAAAACIAGLCALALLPRGRHQAPAPQEQVAMAGHGTAARPAPVAVKAMTLPDGSKVELAAKSSISLEYTDKARVLAMKSGIAYFSVAHNRERPFIVKVGKVRVRAVGTAFNIRNSDGRVTVTVSEGIVDVYPASGGAEAISSEEVASAGALRVDAGKEVVWPEQASGPTISTVDTQHALAWREGRLDYVNEPLSSAIADINRYASRQVIIRDEAVGRIMFTGTVLTGATEEWVQALPDLFPVKVYTNISGDLVLAARDPS